MKRALILVGLALALTAAAPARAADYTIIQQNSCGFSNHTQPCAFTSSVTAGDAIVCVVFGRGVQFPSSTCSDNVNSAYSSAIAEVGNGSTIQLAILYHFNVLAGSTTVSCSGNSFDGFMCSIFEVRGQPSFTNLLDQTAGPNCTSGCTPINSLGTGNITTTHASEIMFSVSFIDGAASPPGWSNSAGWTQQATNYDGSNMGGVIDIQIVTSTGSYSNTFTATGTAGRMAAAIASFVFGAPSMGSHQKAQVY